MAASACTLAGTLKVTCCLLPEQVQPRGGSKVIVFLPSENSSRGNWIPSCSRVEAFGVRLISDARDKTAKLQKKVMKVTNVLRMFLVNLIPALLFEIAG